MSGPRKEVTTTGDSEVSDPKAADLFEILKPPLVWKSKPRYWEQINAALSLASRLRGFEEAQKHGLEDELSEDELSEDKLSENELLTEVAGHMLALDSDPVSQDRLQQLGTQAASFAQVFFDLEKYFPTDLEKIRQSVSEFITGTEDLSSVTISGLVFAALVEVGKRAVRIPLDQTL